MISFLICIILLNTVLLIRSFNIDINHAIVFTDEFSDNSRSSYFGYSVILYSDTYNANQTWVQIGSPRGNTSNFKIREPGVVYRCSIFGPCIEITLEATTDLRKYETNSTNELFAGAWLGGAMDINPKSGRVVICGHRWRGHELNALYYFMEGVCYWSHVNETISKKLIPLKSSGNNLYWTGKSSILYYADGEAGICAHFPNSREQQELLLGAPGVLNWAGTTIIYRDDINNISVARPLVQPRIQDRSHNVRRNGRLTAFSEFSLLNIANSIRTTETVSFELFGYSATSGYFFKKNELLYASAAPRHSYKGQVLIFNFASATDEALQVKTSVKGQQLGEYFGGSLTAGDINQDGLDDLIVGAPYYAGTTYNQGRIYIFLGTLEGKFKTPQLNPIIGGESPGGQFGTSLMFLGNFTNDGYTSVAVGAPYENNNIGAVYIYRGSTIGLKAVPAQKIFGSSFSLSIRGFGISISKPTDVDKNFYNDVAIGAYLSKHVIILRSKPVIRIQQSLVLLTPNLDHTSEQFQLRSCFWYTGYKAPSTINITRKISVDELFVRANLNDDIPVIENRTVRRDDIYCQNITVFIKKAINNRNDPIKVTVTPELILNSDTANVIYATSREDLTMLDTFCKDCPVSNQYLSTKGQAIDFSFALGCGEDNVQACNKSSIDLNSETNDRERTAQINLSAPEELKASWDNYYNLTLQWNYRDITNGSLTKFGITILKMNNECNRSDYMVRKKIARLTYIYAITISINNPDCYTSKLTVRIQSFNEKAGNTSTLEIYSPPEAPTINAFVESVSNTTITIALFSKKLQPLGLFSKSYMYIVLSESKSKFEIGNVEKVLHNLENLETLLPAQLIAKYNLNTEIPMEKLTIGSNHSNNLLPNDVNSNEIKLIPNTSYTITILMYNEYQDRKRYRVYEIVKSTSGILIPFTNQSSGNSSNNALFSIILLVFLLLFWIYYRKRKSGKWCPNVNYRRNIPLLKNENYPNVMPLNEILEISPSQITDPDLQISPKHTMNNINKIKDDINNSKFSKVINVVNFAEYVKKAIINGELERQYLASVSVESKPLNDGYVTPNDYIYDDRAENEYEEIDFDEYAHDIKANYIEGYISKSAYAETKFPKIAAFNNFWKLIWQDDVQYIVLLSSVTKGEKEKDKQYWPKINDSTQFGNIFVKCVSVQIFTDYEHRSFMVSLNNIERQVQQLHFTSWPNHGVPIYAQTLVPLFQVLSTIPESNSPIVVHCSVGMQPIGTIILCDLCLKMAAHEGVIDILKYQRKLRRQKANLIGSFEQYKLVHLVLLECLQNPDSIPCDEEAVNNILSLLETTTVENQFRYITEVAWQDQAMRPLLQVTEERAWKKKNRVQNILASGHGRVYLSQFPINDNSSNYINAVEVDGFKSPKRFIVTQQPLPNTISDFWRMIDEKEVSTVVSLNTINKKNYGTCVFWPTFAINEIRPVAYLLIKFINKVSKEEITILNLELHCNKNKDYFKRDIILIKLKNWPADQLIPNSNTSLMKLWNEVEKLSQPEHPIVLTCYNGATACGLFAAFTFVVEKIKLEHQCDVCLAVRTVRRNREQFVNKLEQFKYLYLAVVSYLTDFRLYANVSSLQQYKNNI